eukprot:2250500-Amphidinium_carterae.1
MSAMTPLPDDHWVSAWQIVLNTGHPGLDAADRIVSRSWLVSVDDLGVRADAAGSAQYLEVLIVAQGFGEGFPASMRLGVFLMGADMCLDLWKVWHQTFPLSPGCLHRAPMCSFLRAATNSD